MTSAKSPPRTPDVERPEDDDADASPTTSPSCRAEQPDPDHLAGEEMARLDCRQDQLDDAVALLLDDADEHPLPVDRDRDQHEHGADQGDSHLGIGALPGGRLERCGHQLGCRWQMPAHAAHCRVCDGGELGVDVRPEHEPVLAQKENGIDVLCGERATSGGRRGDDLHPHLRVKRLRRAPERGLDPAWRGGHHRDAVGLLAVEHLPCQTRRGDDAEQEQGRDDEGAASQALADLALRHEPDRAPPAHGATSSRKSSAREGGP